MILEQLLGNRYLAGSTDERFWSEVFEGRKSIAGVSVSEDSALNYSAYYRAISLIAGSSSTLPIHIYKRISESKREKLDGHPLEAMLNQESNPDMDAATFRETIQAHVLGWGNGYAEIIRAGPRPVRLEILQPNRVKAKRGADGAIAYEVKEDNGVSITLEALDVFHLKNLGGDGLTGWSIARRAKESLGLSLAAEKFGSAFFGNGSRPGGFIKFPGVMKEEAWRKFRESFYEVHGGPQKFGKVGLLEAGMDWVAVGIPPEDAQFLETRRFQVAEIARWFGVPAHLLGDLERATHSNIEVQGIEFLVYCLRYWLVKWEKAINRILLSEAERRQGLYAEFVTDSLLRTDLVTRYNAYNVGVNGGWLSVNDVRQRENLEPVGEAGDIYRFPANMMDVATLLPPGESETLDSADSADGDNGADLLDISDVRQINDWDCGVAATQSVCEFFGVGEKSYQDYITELEATPEDGTQPEAIVDYLNDQGLVTTSGPGMTIDDLRFFFEHGQPVIVPLQMYGTTPEYDQEEIQNRTGHYVVVIGVGLGQVFFQDPSAGRQMLPASEFDKIWHDMEADGVVDEHFGIAVGKEVINPEEVEPVEMPTKELPAPSANGKAPEPTPVPKMQSATIASRKLFEATMARLINKEIMGAKQAAKKPNEFLKWLDSFYDHHRTIVTESLRPVVNVWQAIDGSALENNLAEEISKSYCGESYNSLLEVAGSSVAGQLAKNVETCVNSWTERASKIAFSFIPESNGATAV